MQSFNPAREQFYLEHGEYVVTPDGTVLFITGAEDENAIGGFGRLTFPPTDPWELAKKLAYFWEVKLDQAVTAFNMAKRNLEGRGGELYQWPEKCYSDEERFEHLMKLRKTVRSVRRKYNLAQEEADDLEPKHRKRVREGQSEEDQRAQKLREKLDRVNI